VILIVREKPEELKNSSNYFRDYLMTDEQVEEAHKSAVSKLRQHYLSLGLEKLFVEEIQAALDFKAKDPNRQISRRRLELTLSKTSPEEIMEKYSYLLFLVSTDPSRMLGQGVEYFKHTIFAPLFQSMSLTRMSSQFLEYDRAVRSHFYSIVDEQIDRMVDCVEYPTERYSRLGG
jgi:hypothetical protein